MDAGHRWDMFFPFAYAEFVALLLLQELHVATWLKWGALGISITALAAGSLLEKSYASALVSAIAALGVAMCWVSGSKPVVAEAMSLALFLFFLYLSLGSCMQAWRLFSSHKETHVSVH